MRSAAAASDFAADAALWAAAAAAADDESSAVTDWDGTEFEFGTDSASDTSAGETVDELLIWTSFGAGTTSEICDISGSSSFGLESASATRFAFPSTYRMSVVYSDIQASW